MATGEERGLLLSLPSSITQTIAKHLAETLLLIRANLCCDLHKELQDT